jgi:hypothetical protein
MNALDLANGTSCWNSDTGEAQSFTIDFFRKIQIHALKLQFQAGFVGEICQVEAKLDDEWQVIDELQPEDVLEVQSFPLSTCCETLKLTFTDFTDFYGRVTIYRLEVWGDECK